MPWARVGAAGQRRAHRQQLDQMQQDRPRPGVWPGARIALPGTLGGGARGPPLTSRSRHPAFGLLLKPTPAIAQAGQTSASQGYWGGGVLPSRVRHLARSLHPGPVFPGGGFAPPYLHYAPASRRSGRARTAGCCFAAVRAFHVPGASGKSHALKDLTVHLCSGENIAKYINAKHFDRAVHVSFGNFIKSELGLPLDRALGNICNLFPAVPAGKVKPTMIIDHIEDVMDQPDMEQVLTGFARECRKRNTFKVLVCTSSLAHATSVLRLNGGTKFRLACWPCSSRWEDELLRLYLAGISSTKCLSKDRLESVLSCVVICGSPGELLFYLGLNCDLFACELLNYVWTGKVEEIIAASPKARLHLSSSTAETWSEGFDALKYFAERDSAMGDPDNVVQMSCAYDAVE
jgi:hypothetical protein